MRPPPLNHTNRLLQFVWGQIGVELDADGDGAALWEPSDIHALEDARQGNYRPLAYLLRQRRGLLSPRSFEFLADLLDANLKRPAHRPKAHPDKPYTPAQLAANVVVPRMIKVLLKHYPQLSRGDARDEAVELCARKLNIEGEKIMYLMRRQLGDRRRR